MHKDLRVNLAKLVHGDAEIRWIKKIAFDNPLTIKAAVKDIINFVFVVPLNPKINDETAFSFGFF